MPCPWIDFKKKVHERNGCALASEVGRRTLSPHACYDGVVPILNETRATPGAGGLRVPRGQGPATAAGDEGDAAYPFPPSHPNLGSTVDASRRIAP